MATGGKVKEMKPGYKRYLALASSKQKLGHEPA